MYKKIALISFIIYSLIGFFAIPALLKPQLISTIEEATNAHIALDDVFFNPYTCKLELLGLHVSDAKDAEEKTLLELDALVLNIELYSLLTASIHVSDFSIVKPQFFLVLDKEKKLNMMSIVKENQEPKQEKEEKTFIPRIIIDNIAILDGSIHYEDYSHKNKFEYSVDSIGFKLQDIDTKDLTQSDANLRFYMKLADGGFLDFRSKLASLDPVIVDGSFEYEASKLYTKWRYFQDMLNFEIADGKLYFNTKYHFDMSDLNATTLSDLHVDLRNIRVKPKGATKDIASLGALSVKNAFIKPLAQEVKVNKIVLNGLGVKAKRDKNGVIDWMEYIKINAEDSQEQAKVVEEDNNATAPKWDVHVDDIALENVKFNFEDNAISPSVTTTLNDFDFYAKDVTLAGETPFTYRLNLLVNEKLSCISRGNVKHSVLDANIYAKCSDFYLTHYTPYIDDIAKKELKTYDVALKSLNLGFSTNLIMKDTNSSIGVFAHDTDLHVKNFSVAKRSTNETLLTFDKFAMEKITANTSTKEISVADTYLNGLYLRAARLKDGRLNFDKLIEPKVVKQAKKSVSKKAKATPEKDYHIVLNKVSLGGGKVTFKDNAISPSVTSKIDRIYLTATDIDSKKYTWMKYRFNSRINNSAKVNMNGSVRHTPLYHNGKVKVKKLALAHISPYVNEHAYVDVDEGYINLDAKVKYAKSKTKPDLNVGGSFALSELFISDSRDKTSIFSLRDLSLKNFTLETAPNRFYAKEIGIDSFFVNALIDQNKTMNFATLSKKIDTNTTKKEAKKETKVAKIKDKEEAFPYKIMKIDVKNGSAVFADYSLPIHFKTNIHNLNGKIYSISSEASENTSLNLTGEVDKYGSTHFKGSIQSANPKAYTNINLNFRNLDLPGVSGYSATFAGYKIKKGKLSLDLSYDIQDSALVSTNNILINNIVVGEAMEVEGGSSLPLGLVIGLLEDGDGIINIDLPIGGNIDEPDFKYGKLVWKTLGNLFLKAVTSPFQFLGAAMGVDGDELGSVEFEGGDASLIPSEKEKLYKVSQLLQKRPKLILQVSGTYDEVLDTQALQKAKLIQIVLQRSGAKNEEEKINAMTIDLLEDIYDDMADDSILSKLEDELEEKHENKQAFEQAYFNELVKLCSNIQVVEQIELDSLAQKRRTEILDHLQKTLNVSIDRLKVSDVKKVNSESEKYIKTDLEVIVK